ncbi:MAG: hypothetical protein ACRDKW_04220 [Actinomycetota bacterium]
MVREEGLLLRNILHSRAFAWAEVARFEMGVHRGITVPAAVLRLRDGRQFRITSLEPPNRLTRPRNREAERLVAALNDELRRARGAV